MITEIDEDAFLGEKQIELRLFADQKIRNLAPVLKAQRSQIILGHEVILPFTHTGGFGPVLARDHEISFEAYDRQFGTIPDPDFELDMAISRWLYPYRLSEEKKAAYEKRIQFRFRPACRKLVTGAWNLAGRAPVLAPAFLRLGKMDRFLLRELKAEAAAGDQLEIAAMLAQLEYDPIGGGRPEPGNPERTGNSNREGNFDQEERTDQACNTDQADSTSTDQTGNTEHAGSKEQAGNAVGEESYRQMLQEADAMLTAHRPDLAGMSLRYSIDYPAQRIFQGFIPGENPSLYYVHRLLHRYLGHVQYCSCLEGEADQIGLACDITVSYYMDLIFDPVDQKRQKRQLIYDAVLFAWPGYGKGKGKGASADDPLTAGQVLGWLQSSVRFPEWLQTFWPDGYDLSPEQFQDLFRVDPHDHWNWQGRGLNDSEDPSAWLRSLSMPGGKKSLAVYRKRAKKFGSAGGNLRRNRRAGRMGDAAGLYEEDGGLQKRDGKDYHAFLRQFMVWKEDRILDLDQFDPIYYTLGLARYGDMPLIEPLETRMVQRLEQLAIVIDTSGSCSGRVVRFFLEETWSVFAHAEDFFDQFRVHLIQADAAVQEDVVLTSLRDVDFYMQRMTIKGGGGTDFRPAFRYIRKLQEEGKIANLRGILYFTDGFGTFPDLAPGCPTAFVMLKHRYGQVSVPPWAEKLLLEVPEDAGWTPEYTGAFQVSLH